MIDFMVIMIAVYILYKEIVPCKNRPPRRVSAEEFINSENEKNSLTISEKIFVFMLSPLMKIRKAYSDGCVWPIFWGFASGFTMFMSSLLWLVDGYMRQFFVILFFCYFAPVYVPLSLDYVDDLFTKLEALFDKLEEKCNETLRK